MAASTLSKSFRQLFDRCNPVQSNTLQIGGLIHDVELICTGGGNVNLNTYNQSSSLSSVSHDKSTESSLVGISGVSNLVKSCVTGTSVPAPAPTTKHMVTIRAHRSILSARSPVFEAMFNTDMSECITGKTI